MNDKVLIIGSRESGTKNDPRVIRDNLKEKGMAQADLALWENLVFSTAGDPTIATPDGKRLEEYGLVLAFGWYKSGKQLFYRDLAFTVALYLEKKNIPFWNSEMGAQRSITKLSTSFQLLQEGISVPPTLFSMDGASLQREAVKAFAFPMIVKAIAASRGEHNFLVSTPEELEEKLVTGEPNRYLVQPFMPNDHDLRAVCFAGEPYLVFKRMRQSENTHLNNTSQGGMVEEVPLAAFGEQLSEKCRKICRILGREMGGIDLIPDSADPDGYACLEVNAIPQLTSGSLIDEKMNLLYQAIMKSRKGND